MSGASSILTVVALLAAGGLAALAYVMLLRRAGTGRAWQPGRTAAVAAAAAGGPRSVSLRAVISRLAAVGDEESVLLDRPSGKFVTLGDRMLAGLEGDEPIEDLMDDTIAFSETQLDDFRRKLRAKQLVPLPTKAETKEFQLRERFCAALPEGEAKEEMQKVLRGQTGYRSFDAAVARLHIAEQWERCRDAGFAPVAVEWLQLHEIRFVRDFAIQDETPQLRQAG